MYSRSNELEKSITNYDKAIELNSLGSQSWHKHSYYNRAAIKSSLGDFKGAIADLDQAIEGSTNYRSHAYYVRGIIKDRLEDHEGANLDFSLAIEDNDHGVDTYYLHSISRRRSEEHILIINNCNIVISTNPKDGNSLCKRAAAKGALGDFFANEISPAFRSGA